MHYLIHWIRNDPLTWELAKSVEGLQAVRGFHQRYPRKPGRLENVLGGPRIHEGDTVMAQAMSDGLKGT